LLDDARFASEGTRCNGDVHTTGRTPSGIAYDRAGPRGGVPVVLVHAGVADRRMWEPQWPALTDRHDAVRLDLRGFGDSTGRPDGPLSPPDDVLAVLAAEGVERCHLVGASYGAGVAAEVALTRPGAVASLLLAGPGGSLIAEATDDLRAFGRAENAALDAGDLDAAVEANLRCWVDGPGRPADRVAPGVRDLVARMQRRAFELTADWDDVEEAELEPPALARLTEIDVRTLVLVGDLDLDAIRAAADRVAEGVRGSRLVAWEGVAHLPSLERPEAFLRLLEEHLDR
jgi:pimeloyl-ACP methyl ester carboxylesterase